MKKIILKSCDIRFNFHTEQSILYYTIHSHKPKKEVSIIYSFWDFSSYKVIADLKQKLSKNEKLMENLIKIALKLLKEDRKQGYVKLSQGQAVTGKHIIKVTFEFENIKYEVKKIKKKQKNDEM